MRGGTWFVRALAVIVVAAVGLGLYRVATGTTSSSRHQSSLEQVRNMLRDRAMALAHGDVEGYLRPLAPRARSFEDSLARGSQTVPLADVRLTAIPLRTQDIESDTFKDLPVLFIYRYRDVPADNQFEYSYLSTIERQNGAWVVTSSRPKKEGAHGDSQSQPPVWATGPTEFRLSGHFLAIHRPGLPHEAEAIALAEQARQRMLPRVLLEFDPVHVLILAADDHEYAELVGDPTFTGSSVGLARFQFSADPVAGLKLATNREMIVNTTDLFIGGATVPLHGDDRAPVQIMQHELGHLALFRYMTPDTPNWLNEGGAMYLADEHRVLQWKAGTRAHQFDGFAIAGIEAEWEMDKTLPLKAKYYPYANAAVLALIETGGPQPWFDYYKRYKYTDEFANGLEQSKEKPTDILLQRFYKMNRAELDTLTKGYITRAVAAAG